MLNVYEKSSADSVEPKRAVISPNLGTISGRKICFVLEDNGVEIGWAEVNDGDCYCLQSIACEDVYFDFFSRSVLFILSNKLSKRIYVPITEAVTAATADNSCEIDRQCASDCSGENRSNISKYRGKSRADYYKQFGFTVESETHLAVFGHEIVFPHECGK